MGDRPEGQFNTCWKRLIGLLVWRKFGKTGIECYLARMPSDTSPVLMREKKCWPRIDGLKYAAVAEHILRELTDDPLTCSHQINSRLDSKK
ncbi:hypothetical protein MHYP_G00218360 [Metynnis hypsauchen]